jgi:hypothetical protein
VRATQNVRVPRAFCLFEGVTMNRPFPLRTAAHHHQRFAARRVDLQMPHPKDDPKSCEWRPYLFARDQWHCRICGDRFLYSEMVRKHIADEHDENMPPSMYEYFRGAVWQRKKIS